MADASGHVCGSSLVSQEATQVWVGRVTALPERQNDGFAFACQSLDRVLDEQMAGRVSGDVTGTGDLFLLPVGWTFSVALQGTDDVGATVWEDTIVCQPFAGMVAEYKTSAEIRALISTAWDDAVSDAGATSYLGTLTWMMVKGNWHSSIQVIQQSTVYGLSGVVTLEGDAWDLSVAPFPTGMQSDLQIDLQMGGTIPSFSPLDPAKVPVPLGLTIRLTEGSPDDVPDTGKVKVTSGGVSCTYYYSGTGTAEQDLFLDHIEKVQGQTALTLAQIASGATAEILAADEGPYALLALHCLESSGTGLRGTYDTLAQGQGYGLDESLIEVPTFATLADGGAATIIGNITSAGSSFGDLFGGILALFRLAVVARPTDGEANSPVRLHLVATAQGTDYTTLITDADFLAHADDPVVSVKRATNPNIIEITRQPAGIDSGDHLFYNDKLAAEAVGKTSVTYRIDATDRDTLAAVATPVVPAHFAYDATIQAVEIRVHPSVAAEVGDCVWLTSTHPSLWTWTASPGCVGYDGPARVVGRRINPKTLAVTLALLVDGSLVMHALSPAAEVRAFDSAADPTWIRVDYKYLKHFSNSLEDEATITVLHYQPGEVETSDQKYTVSAAAAETVSGTDYCRLSVAVFDPRNNGITAGATTAGVDAVTAVARTKTWSYGGTWNAGDILWLTVDTAFFARSGNSAGVGTTADLCAVIATYGSWGGTGCTVTAVGATITVESNTTGTGHNGETWDSYWSYNPGGQTVNVDVDIAGVAGVTGVKRVVQDTLTGPCDVGDEVSLTEGATTVTYTVDVGDTLADVAAGIAAAASGFATYDVTSSTATVIRTAKVAGVAANSVTTALTWVIDGPPMPVLDTTKRSTLTLPVTAETTEYQRLFAHTDDGSQWG